MYAHSYSKATGAGNVIRTATHTDPASGVRTGSNVTANTSDNVLGVRDCYSYSYATLTSYLQPVICLTNPSSLRIDRGQGRSRGPARFLFGSARVVMIL